jgi:hypothetical protein
MPTPTSRSKILPARGSKANLDAALAAGDLLEGELCYAKDEDALYQVEGGVLVKAGGGLQPGDNVSEPDIPAVPVTSVAGKTGDVTLVKADITDFSDADYATAAQGVKADTAVQPGDNVSTLVNDAGYITDAGVTQIVAGTNVTIDPVGGTGAVTVNATLPVGGGVLDGGDFNTGNDTADGTAQLDGGLFT